MTISASSSTPSTDATRTRAKLWRPMPLAAILIGVAVLAFALSFPIRRFYTQQAAVQTKARIQKAIVEEVKKLGGKLAYADSISRQPVESLTVESVDLTNTPADGILFERLCQLTSIQRLNLDGTNIQKGDMEQVTGLSKLESLSLARTNIGQSDLVAIAKLPRLKALSLRGTKIGDDDVAPMSEMTALASLDVSHTNLTAVGMKILQGLPSLRAISLDDHCVTPESVLILQSATTLQMVEVCVASGFGKEARDLLSGKLTATVQGFSTTGVTLWHASARWDETLAGVVSAVVTELSLESKNIDRLIAAMSGCTFDRRPPYPYRPNPEVEGPEIKSCDQFLDALRTNEGHTKSVRAFARDKFSKSDIPKLLQVLRTHDSRRPGCGYFSFLLANHGQDDPEAVRQLESMLNDEDPIVRALTIYGFGQWTAESLHEDWVPSEKLAEFAVPRLLRLCEDEAITVRQNVSLVLGSLTVHHPKYAPLVMPALVKNIREGYTSYTDYSMSRIAQVNKDAAIAVVPELRRMLANAASELPADVHALNLPPAAAESSYRRTLLNAISTCSVASPSLAKEIAVEHVQMMRSGIGDGEALVKLVSANNPDAVWIIIYGLLEIAEMDDDRVKSGARFALGAVATAIRDWRAAAENSAPQPKR